VGLVKALGPAAIPASALNFPDNRTCAFLPTLASVEVQVTKQLPASFAAMDALKSSDVALAK
jgi:hypothetical protein